MPKTFNFSTNGRARKQYQEYADGFKTLRDSNPIMPEDLSNALTG